MHATPSGKVSAGKGVRRGSRGCSSALLSGMESSASGLENRMVEAPQKLKELPYMMYVSQCSHGRKYLKYI